MTCVFFMHILYMYNVFVLWKLFVHDNGEELAAQKMACEFLTHTF